jgi:hypothetical protein
LSHRYSVLLRKTQQKVWWRGEVQNPFQTLPINGPDSRTFPPTSRERHQTCSVSNRLSEMFHRLPGGSTGLVRWTKQVWSHRTPKSTTGLVGDPTPNGYNWVGTINRLLHTPPPTYSVCHTKKGEVFPKIQSWAPSLPMIQTSNPCSWEKIWAPLWEEEHFTLSLNDLDCVCYSWWFNAVDG